MANKIVSKLALATLSLGLGFTVLNANSAQALTFGFDNIDTGATSGSELSGDPFVNDFGFEVLDGGNGTVLFNFTNADTTGQGHFIGDLYWDDSTSLLSNINLNVGNVGTVSFKTGNTNLPQGQNIDFSADFGIKKNGAARNGVNGGETLGVAFNGNFDNVVAALSNGDLRVGIHVQALPGGQSDAFVSKLPTVGHPGGGNTGNTAGTPEPLTMVGSLAALGFGAAFKKKLGKKKS